jgi:hypothetical protein
MSKLITNTKYDLKSLPYYKEIADLMENFDVNALKTLKGTLDSLNIQTQDLSKNDILINKDNIDINNMGNDIKSVETLEEINKEFSETLNFLDAKILLMKDKIDKNKNDSPEKNISRSKVTKTTIIKNDIP